MSDEPGSRPTDRRIVHDRPTTRRPTVEGRALRATLFLSILWSLGFAALPIAPATAAPAAPIPITTGVPRFEAAP